MLQAVISARFGSYRRQYSAIGARPGIGVRFGCHKKQKVYQLRTAIGGAVVGHQQKRPIKIFRPCDRKLCQGIFFKSYESCNQQTSTHPRALKGNDKQRGQDLFRKASLRFSSHQSDSTYTIYHYQLLPRYFSIVLQSLLLPSSSPAITEKEVGTMNFRKYDQYILCRIQQFFELYSDKGFFFMQDNASSHQLKETIKTIH